MESRTPMADAQDIRFETAETGPVGRSISVTVEAPRVKKAFDRAYKNLAKGAQVKGFRKGKVPRSVLERLYGAEIVEEIERMLVAETLPDALEQAELLPVSEPEIESDRPEIGSDFRYTAKIEVKPEIELPELAGLPAKRPPVTVDETEILTELDSLRERQAPLVEEPEETEAAQGHFLNVDFEGFIDDEAFEGGAGKDVVIEIGSGRMIPGFEDQLVGAKSGDQRDVRVTFPEDYQAEELAGKDARFDVQITSIRRRELPELDDEFAKDLGDFDWIDALRDRIRADLEASREKQAKAALHRSVHGLADRALRLRGAARAWSSRQLAAAAPAAAPPVPRPAAPTTCCTSSSARMQEDGRPAAERRVREMLLLDADGHRPRDRGQRRGAGGPSRRDGRRPGRRARPHATSSPRSTQWAVPAVSAELRRRAGA